MMIPITKLFKIEQIVLFLLINSTFSHAKGSNKMRSSKTKVGKSGGGNKNLKLETKTYDDSRVLVENDTDDIPLNLPDEQVLISELLSNYDSAARPVFNASMPVVVKFNFALIQIIDMDERNQILTTNVWIEHEWFDERLKWNNSDFNNLDKIRLPCDRLWIPDIILYNSADEYSQEYPQIKAMVKPDGEIFWAPPAKLRSSCKLDVTYFPFDDQVCTFKFGSWAYSGLQVDLVNRSTQVDMSNYVQSGEWELRAVLVERNLQYYPCCPNEPYPDIKYYIFIRRRVFYYLNNVILPVVWLSILSLLVFWLPPGSGDKISLGITVLLSFSMFMLLIAENVPTTSDSIPIVGIYLTIIMALSSMSIILTVLVLRLHHTDQFVPTCPKGLYNFFTKVIAKYVMLGTTVKLYEANMEKLEAKHKENNMYTYNQPVSISTTTTSPVDFILSYDKCDFDTFNDYNKLSSIKEHASVCQNCKRKYLSRNLIENLSCMDSNTKDTIRNNLQNEWRLLALIVDRFLFWLFSTLTVVSTVILLIIVPLIIRNDKVIKP